MKALLLVVALGMSTMACSVTAGDDQPARLTDQERAIAQAGGVPADVAARVRVFGPIARLQVRTADYDEVDGAGMTVEGSPGEGHATLERLRSVLVGSDYRAYLADNAFGHGPDRIAVLAADDLGYLAAARPDGINLDLDHDAVMARYRQWAAAYGLELTGAGGDWIEARITREPKDWLAFAREVYAFCPDIVEQGTDTVEAAAAEMERTRTLYLWWD